MDILLKLGSTQSTVLRANQIILKQLEDLCSYQKMSDRAKFYAGLSNSQWDGRASLLNRFNGSFPTGLAPRIVRFLKEQGHTVSIEKDLPKTFESEKMKGITPLSNLRGYQKEAIQEALKYKRGIWQMVTGSGKTESAIGLVGALKRPTIFFVHTKELVDQTIARFQKYFPDIKVGKIGEGIIDPGQVTVASIPTVASWLIPPEEPNSNKRKMVTDQQTGQKRFETDTEFQQRYLKWEQDMIEWEEVNARATVFLAKFPVAIFDECFPAGTLVNNIPIEQLKVGDKIPSFNHQTNKIETQKIYNILKSKPKELVELTFSNGQTFVCTGGHPIFTEFGYLPAKNIQGLTVYAKTEETNIDQLLRVSYRNDLRRKARISTISSWPTILFNRMQKYKYQTNMVGNNDSNKQKDCTRIFQKNERKEPYAFARMSCENETNTHRYELEASSARGEWERSHRTSETSCREVKLGDGSYCENWTKASRGSVSLQNRYCKFRVKNCNRSRWDVPLSQRTASTRSTKNRFFTELRVESVKILQQTSDGTFGGVLSDGFVYNLEVETNHNYFANNILVHNCHHLSADTFFVCAQACNGTEYLVAMSGTPYRDDGLELFIEAGSGKILYSIDYSKLITLCRECDIHGCNIPEHSNCLVPAEIHIHDYAPLPAMDLPSGYNQQYKICITENDDRNERIAEIAKLEFERGLSVLVLCREIPHIERLSEFFTSHNIPHKIAHGKHKDRKKNLESFKTGQIKVLISSTILDEGYDMPEIDVVILAGGGKSRVKSYQRIGRALRPYPGKEKAIIHDFRDTIKPFSYHFKQRLALYSAEKAFTVINHCAKSKREVVKKSAKMGKLFEVEL